MHRKIFLLELLMALFFFCSNAMSQSHISISQIDKFFSPWNKPDIPGASIAIIQDGKVLLGKGYGMANLEYAISNSPSTVFQVASVSKQVTAFAVLLLERQGKLSLNDDVRKYIPELPDFGKVISLKHLLFHTSGLRDYWNLLSMAGWRYDDIITKSQLLNMICSQKGLNFQPGSEYVYSNTGYFIIAEVVSRVSGMSFSDFTRENIFKPLKMNSTLFLDDNEKVVRNLAESYYMSDKGYKKCLLNHSITGSTNLLTTVKDMTMWIMNFENPVVGDRDMIDKMDTRGTLDTGDTINYAMGLETGPYKGLMLIGHRGAERGYRSFLGRFPDEHLSIIVFSNNSEIDPTSIGLNVADIILKEQFKAEPDKSSSTRNAPGPDLYTGDNAILKTFEGRYELRPGYIISVTNENDKLFVEGHEVPKSQLIRTSDSEFILPAIKAKLIFAGDNKTGTDKLLVNLNGQQMVAPRIKDFDPSAVNPVEYTGVFFSPELGTVYTFANSGKSLTVKHSRMDDFDLKATGSDQFSGDKSFCNRIDFVRDTNKTITGCLMSAGRVRNIWFKKID